MAKKTKDCLRCGGKGKISVVDGEASSKEITCRVCQGKGKVK